MDELAIDRLITRLTKERAEGCCMDDKWRGHACGYHDGYADGLEDGFSRGRAVGWDEGRQRGRVEALERLEDIGMLP